MEFFLLDEMFIFYLLFFLHKTCLLSIKIGLPPKHQTIYELVSCCFLIKIYICFYDWSVKIAKDSKKR